MNNRNPIINVTSYHQAGGITAHTVNLMPPARHLDEGAKAQLRSMIPGGSKVKIMCVWGDQEAIQFANENHAFLAANNYEVGPVTHAMWNQQILGQIIEKTPEGYAVIIGSNRNP